MLKKFFALFFTNFWGVLNDNFLKTLACFIAINWVDKEYYSLVVSSAAGALVLPYLIFSPLAAHLSNNYKKINIVRYAKWAEIPIMLTAIAGFCLQSTIIVILSILLMGLQSALYSPSKYSLIKDIGGKNKVSYGMGGMEAVAFLAMLIGMVIASFTAENIPIYIPYILLISFAVIGLISSYFIKAKETKEYTNYSINPFKFLAQSHKICKQHPGLNTLIYTLSVFWWIAATMQIGLLVYCQENLNLHSFNTGIILSLTAIGITLGCYIAGIIDKKIFLLGYVPSLSIILCINFIILFSINWSENIYIFTALLFFTAFIAGLFKVPMDAEIQKRVSGNKLNLILAYFNQVSFIFILLASVSFSLLTIFLSVEYMFLMLAIVSFISAIYIFLNYRSVICFFCSRLLNTRYKIKFINKEVLNSDKALLLLPNHTAVVDPMLMFAQLYEYRLQPLVDELYFKNPLFSHILTLFNSIEVPDLRKHRSGIEQVKQLKHLSVDALTKGSNLIFYPSGHITTDGIEKIGSRNLAYQVCAELPENAEVILVKITGLWGSSTSRKGKKRTPDIGQCILKGIRKIFTQKRRKVTIEFTNMTTPIREWAQTEKTTFNTHLEDFYNN